MPTLSLYPLLDGRSPQTSDRRSRLSVLLSLGLVACQVDGSVETTGLSAGSVAASSADSTDDLDTIDPSVSTGDVGTGTQGQTSTTGSVDPTGTSFEGGTTVAPEPIPDLPSDTTGVEPVCGDGEVEGVEECDDGNQDDSDECPSTCMTAACGDGFVQMGVEECDDANEEDEDGCNVLCEGEYYVFATNQTFNGALGGISGAKDKCQNAAQAAGLKGDFDVFLSVPGNDPAFRLGYEGVYTLTDPESTVVAYDWNQLVDPEGSGLEASIHLDEYGQILPDTLEFWSNTTNWGYVFEPEDVKHCNGWTELPENGSFMAGMTGFLETQKVPTWMNYNGPWLCDEMKRLVCIQVPLKGQKG